MSKNGNCTLDGNGGYIIANGFWRKKVSRVNATNFRSFISADGHFDFKLAGNIVIFDYLPIGGTSIILPSVYSGAAEDSRDYARSFIGSTLLIHNNTDEEIKLIGAVEQDGSFNNYTINPHNALLSTCRLHFDGSSETVYWDKEIGRSENG